MTSLAHLMGMIYDLRDEVERHKMFRYPEALTKHGKSSDLSEHDGASDGNENFEVSLDISPFKFEEVAVKVRDKFIIVDARHDEREDEYGSVSRQFTRKYVLPDEFDTDTIESFLKDDGKLTIKADKKMKKADIGGDRFIPIQQHASTEDELS